MVIVVDQNVLFLEAQEVDVLVLYEPDVLRHRVETELYLDGGLPRHAFLFLVLLHVLDVQKIQVLHCLPVALVVHELLQDVVDLPVPFHLLGGGQIVKLLFQIFLGLNGGL